MRFIFTLALLYIIYRLAKGYLTGSPRRSGSGNGRRPSDRSGYDRDDRRGDARHRDDRHRDDRRRDDEGRLDPDWEVHHPPRGVPRRERIDYSKVKDADYRDL